MKKGLILLGALSAAPSCFSQDTPPSPPDYNYVGIHQTDELNPSILAVNRSASLNWIESYFYYIEPSGPDVFNTGTGYEDYEQGWMGGVGFAGSYMSDGGWYGHAEWNYVQGKVAYTGFFSNGSPASGSSHAIINSFEFKFGHGFSVHDNWMVTPYLGFGGRHWVRELGPGEVGDFVESYNHYFLGIGNLAQYSPTPGWTFTGDAFIGRTISPQINSPDAGLSNVPLGVAPVIKLGIETDYQLVGPVHGFAGFNMTYFSYGQSGVQSLGGGFGVLEPPSHTEEYNYVFGFRYCFDTLSGLRIRDAGPEERS